MHAPYVRRTEQYNRYYGALDAQEEMGRETWLVLRAYASSCLVARLSPLPLRNTKQSTVRERKRDRKTYHYMFQLSIVSTTYRIDVTGRTARFPRIWPESPTETGKAEPRHGTLPNMSDVSLVTQRFPSRGSRFGELRGSALYFW